jgi:hypothetical protein
MFDDLRLRSMLCFGSNSTLLVGVILVNLGLVFHVSPWKPECFSLLPPHVPCSEGSVHVVMFCNTFPVLWRLIKWLSYFGGVFTQYMLQTPRRTSLDLVTCWGAVSSSANCQAGRPPLVGCPWLIIQYIFSYPPYLQSVSPLYNLMTHCKLCIICFANLCIYKPISKNVGLMFMSFTLNPHCYYLSFCFSD